MATISQVIRRHRKRVARRRALAAQRSMWTSAITVGVLLGGVVPLLVMLAATLYFYSRAIIGLPSPASSMSIGPAAGVTQLYDRSGTQMVYAVQDPLAEGRDTVALADLPTYVVQATLRAEDPDFLTSARFNPISVFVRMWSHILFEPLPPDPSLTGRLVRNVILPQAERVSNDDRLREIILVADLNRRYAPQELLAWHLNTNDYGNGAYGIEAAAQIYLGKSARDLTLDEAALLAAIPTAPQYNPFDNSIAARGRQQDLLRSMLNAEDITRDQHDEAAAVVTVVRPATDFLPAVAPEYLLYARRQAEQLLNAQGRDGSRLMTRGGLRITTALDLDLYAAANCAVQSQLARLGTSPAPSGCPDGLTLPPQAVVPPGAKPDAGALAVVDVAAGELRALVGDALTPRYEPGMTLQPFVYLQAFLGGYTPASMVLDIPSRLPGAQEGLIYTPQNLDQRFRGPLNLRDAMGAALLPPAAQLADEEGMYQVIRLAQQMGVNSLDDTSPVLLLNQGGAVSVLDMTYAYSVFASLGQMRGIPVEPVARGFRVRDPAAVLRIEGPDGEVLWEYSPAQVSLNEITLPERGLAYLVTDILADQRTRWGVMGQGTALDLSRPGAVVNSLTGRQGTAEATGAWTVGYTPQYVVGVHLGRSDGESFTLDSFGLGGAAPVWRAVTEYVHDRDGVPPSLWQQPPNIVTATVCERSGNLPNGACPARQELFLDGMQALLQPDTQWEMVEINSRTNQRATVNTPAELRSQQVFFIPPDDALDWWRANNQPLPPAEFDTVSGPQILDSAQILQPAQFDQVGGTIEVRGTFDAPLARAYQLSWGEGRNPATWFDIGEPQTTFAPNGVLGTWDTTGLDGIYSLLLTVEMQDGTSESAAVQVTVDNTLPTIVLTAGAPGQVFRWPADRTIPLDADARDNLAMRSVEFYADGVFIGAAEQFPFAFNWTIEGPGDVAFSAIAIDQVGNRAETGLTVSVARSGG